MTVEIENGRPVGYLTTKEFSNKVHVELSTVRVWMRRNKLDVIKIGNDIWVKETQEYPEEKKRGRKTAIKIVKNMEDADVKDIFSARLASVLRDKKISQFKFSTMIDVSAFSVSDYVNGKRLPSGETLVRIAKALSISLDWLVGLKDEE